ncbi:hypothetical protein [Trichoplusia ni ascovirus 2c]|uniref:hypothetical protein n=1 Tax=Trichoplusia ni ascovirus 2c TaxID=328615 RepID=UPI0000E4420A|nr:hypothetical protein TNAV2c_gp050 [Trichoplusia ni ascovirus 2c]ABF70567.1 hypothetical protein [Trichoplusia ni ascovirus 2c]
MTTTNASGIKLKNKKSSSCELEDSSETKNLLQKKTKHAFVDGNADDHEEDYNFEENNEDDLLLMIGDKNQKPSLPDWSVMGYVLATMFKDTGL